MTGTMIFERKKVINQYSMSCDFLKLPKTKRVKPVLYVM